MDKEYLKKHNLMEAHRQFMRLSEGYLATSLAEEGEDEETPSEGQEMPNQDDMGPQQPQAGEPIPQEGPEQEPAPEGDGMDGQEMPPAPSMPEGPIDSGMEMGNEPEAEAVSDDVLDVEDLTQAQEKLNKKQNAIGHDLGEVDDRIIALLTAVEGIKDSIEKNNSDITALKAELEKRVPTDKEKLSMQSLNMYPYNVSPKDYWEDKEKGGHYVAQDEKPKKEFKITQDDVDGYSDREVEDSFDDELHQTMKDIFKGF